MWRRPRGRAINTSLFAQPQIKVSTAAEVMNLWRRMKRSFEGNGGVMASLLGNEHTHCTRARSALRHARKQKKRETFVSLFLVPRAGVEPAQG